MCIGQKKTSRLNISYYYFVMKREKKKKGVSMFQKFKNKQIERWCKKLDLRLTFKIKQILV